MPPRVAPALVTCTSSEYLGHRPLRRIVRERPLIVVLGAPGTGKTRVAERVGRSLAREGAGAFLRLDTRALEEELVRRTRAGAWPARLLDAAALVLDGPPAFLRGRPGRVAFLRELVAARVAAGRTTIVCQVTHDEAVACLVGDAAAGSLVTIGLRFPASRSGRLRFARRACDELGLAKSAATGTDQLAPWRYDAVLAELERRRAVTA